MPSYIAARRTKRIFQYAIERRARALIRHFQQVELPAGSVVLDVGTADGMVLRRLERHCGVHGIGVDVELDHLKAARENVTHLVQADGRLLPFGPGSIDAIISTAVFKHIYGLEKLVAECQRVLKPKGILAVIDPTPLGTRMGILLGHLPRESVFQILGLKDIKKMLERHGFTVLASERFMLAPIPFPGGEVLERTLQKLRLDRLFLNHIVCAQHTSG